MLKILETKKTVREAAEAVGAAAPRHGFGLLHAYDLKAKLAEKGVDFPNECRILEICNPRFAAEVMGNDMSIAMALPCRIAVYEEGGRTKIGTIPPTELLGLFPGSAASRPAAERVEAALSAIMEESARI
jgi:uncharacterized protein (DUF302 family)